MSIPRMPLMVSVALTLSSPGWAQPPASSDRLGLEKYLDMEGVGDPRLAPDGSEIVYVRDWIDPMSDSRKSALWIMNSDGSQHRHLTDGQSPRWAPNGDRLAFLACGTPGGDRNALAECGAGSHQQIYVRIMAGAGEGAITQVTRLTESASNIQWSPDGAVIAFSALVPSQGPQPILPPGKPRGATWTEEPRIVDELDYRQDGRGFDRPGFTHIFTVTAEGGTPRQVTSGDYDHGASQWTPDGQTIVFDAFRRGEPDHHWYAGSYLGRASEIYAVDTESRNIRRLTTLGGIEQTPRVSPDGRSIAYLRSDSTDNTYVVRQMFLMNVDGSNPRHISDDFDRRTLSLMWAPDGSGVYFTAENHGSRDLYFASRNGGVNRVTEGEHVLMTSDINRNGTAVATWSTPHGPGDIVSFDLDRPELNRLTRVNDDVLASVALGDVEDFWYESVDGWQAQGWIVKPPDFDPSRRYPLILHIHGGPHAMYTHGFNYSFQNFAANDFVVLYTNPRGSSGYGTEFGNGINNAWPGKDYDDLMHGVDAVLERGYVDPDNLFVTGCSGGGILTAWTVTQTDRFAAAASRCPITNFISFVGTTDGASWFQNFDKFPWEDPTEHLERSPLMHVENVTTPTLMMVGEKDLRTPVPETEQFYVALKVRQVPTRMILMKEEWHGTGRKPSNFMRTQLYLMDWFQQYMSEEMKRGRAVTDRP